jgi:hypothetical protein
VHTHGGTGLLWSPHGFPLVSPWSPHDEKLI